MPSAELRRTACSAGIMVQGDKSTGERVGCDAIRRALYGVVCLDQIGQLGPAVTPNGRCLTDALDKIHAQTVYNQQHVRDHSLVDGPCVTHRFALILSSPHLGSKVGLFDKSKVFVGGVFMPLRHDLCAVVQCAHKRLDGLYKCAHRQHVAASINDLVASVLVRMGAHYDRHLLDARLDRGE